MAGGGAVGAGAGCRTRWLHPPAWVASSAAARPRWVVVAEADARMGGPRRGHWRCRRGWGCGPSAAQAGSERSQLAAGSALTCDDWWWARQDLNLGRHPDPGCLTDAGPQTRLTSTSTQRRAATYPPKLSFPIRMKSEFKSSQAHHPSSQVRVLSAVSRERSLAAWAALGPHAHPRRHAHRPFRARPPGRQAP